MKFTKAQKLARYAISILFKKNNTLASPFLRKILILSFCFFTTWSYSPAQSVTVSDGAFLCFFGETFTLNGTLNGRNRYTYFSFDIEWTGSQWQIRAGANIFAITTSNSSPNPPDNVSATANGTPWVAGPACTGGGPFTITGDGTQTSIDPSCTTPTAGCMNATVSLSSGGTISISSATVNNGSVGDMACNPVLSVSSQMFTCSQIGPNTVTLTITDDVPNTSTCTAVVTIQDNQNPTANCKDVTVQLEEPGDDKTISGSDVDSDGTPSNDNCGITLAVSPNYFTIAELGMQTFTLTVTDDGSNTATCTGTAQVVDDLLPVELLYFKGEALQRGNALSWATATEVNNAFFTIERSTNNWNWVEIAKIEGRGNSFVQQNYSYLDRETSDISEAYYRLKQTDFDATFTYSDIIRLESKSDKLDITVVPNPVHRDFNIHFNRAIDPADTSLILYALDGQQLSLTVNQREAGLNVLLPEGLASGIYLLALEIDSERIIKEIIVQ